MIEWLNGGVSGVVESSNGGMVELVEWSSRRIVNKTRSNIRSPLFFTLHLSDSESSLNVALLWYLGLNLSLHHVYGKTLLCGNLREQLIISINNLADIFLFHTTHFSQVNCTLTKVNYTFCIRKHNFRPCSRDHMRSSE